MHRWCLHFHQLLPQLLMEQFNTLPIQYRHIENMHEGVLICFDKMTAVRSYMAFVYAWIMP